MPTVTAVLTMAGGGGWKQAIWRGREDATRAPHHLQDGHSSTGWLEGKGSWEKPGVKGAREQGNHHHLEFVQAGNPGVTLDTLPFSLSLYSSTKNYVAPYS